MTKDWKKPKASHKHVVCERVDLFWLQDVSKENWDDTSKASDWLLIGRMDGGTSASPHYSFTQGCQTYGLRATSSPQDNLMWIINDLSYVGVEASALLSIHAGMGGSLFFYGHVANHMQIYVKEERGADVPRQQV